MKHFFSLIFLFLAIYQHAVGQVKKITVAQDGSSDYKTVQQANNAVNDSNAAGTIVFIKTVCTKKNFAYL